MRLLILGFLCFLAGCAGTIAYLPNVRLVEDLGLSEAKRRLTETIGRAVVPHAGAVEVNDESLHYRWQQVIHGPYGIPVGTAPRESLITFANVDEIQIFTNHYVYVWGPGRRSLDPVLFGSEEDAKTFADLLMSLRERRLRR